MLVFESFHKKYRKETILTIEHLELENDIYWLKGENGAGKSTFLKSVSGIIPFDGDVLIDHTSLQKNKLQQRSWINYGEAEPIYPTFLTGEELLSFVQEVKGGTNELAFYLVSALKMKGALKEKIGTYSSGMKKKLSLILAFCGTPKWIFLDEPLITLDLDAVEVLLQTIEQQYLNDVSLIITSHQPFQLKTTVQRILIIENKTLTLV